MKKVSVRILSILLCLTMLIPLAISCKKIDSSEEESGDTPKTTVSTAEGETENLYDENGYLKDDLDPTLDFDGFEFHMLGWNSGYNSDFFVEMDTGDTIADSVYFRNQKVMERLNLKLLATFIDGDNANQAPFVDQCLSFIMSGDTNEFDLIGSYSMCAGSLATQGALTEMSNLKHLDFEKPWWSSSLIEMSKIGDQLYFVTGDASNALLYNLYFLIVNKKMLRELKLDDPRKMVLDGTWTLDKFFDMTKDVYDDSDGAAGVTGGDKFGFTCFHQVHLDCFLASSGIRMAAENEEGVLQLTTDFLGEKTQNLIEKVNNWLWFGGDSIYNSESGYDNIFNGNSLFGTVAGSTIQYFTKTKWEHGILPYPKADAEQEQYYTNLGFAFTFFSIPLNVENAEISSAVLECMNSESYRSSSHVLFENGFKSRWATDELDSPMYDIIKNNLYVDACRVFSSSFEWTKSAVFTFRSRLSLGKNEWQSEISKHKDTINKTLENISKNIKG